jgi:hypothetical protein
LIAATAGYWAARIVPAETKLMSLVALIAGGLGYVAALVAVREIGRSDLDAVLRVVRRRKA